MMRALRTMPSWSLGIISLPVARVKIAIAARSTMIRRAVLFGPTKDDLIANLLIKYYRLAQKSMLAYLTAALIFGILWVWNQKN